MKIGSSITFLCDAYKVHYWTFQSQNMGRLFPNNSVAKYEKRNNYLEITNVTEKNEGTYKCYGRTKQFHYFIAPAKLLIKGKLRNSYI